MSSSGGGNGSREVAKGVANLGNTCYMNAVLQALAHAPELCLAMDCEPHRVICPIASKNTKRRKKKEEEEMMKKKSQEKGGESVKKEETKEKEEAAVSSSTTHKGKKSKKGKGSRSPPREESEAAKDPFANDMFCALCEVERHLELVHGTQQDAEPKVNTASPTNFVNGFMSEVAPWFKRGVQEDSHEFLRLLIEAMQKSSSSAVVTKEESRDQSYPFKLFRGTVESNVKCSSCNAVSSTLDPYEDITLDVTPQGNNSALADVTSALERFIRAERLDAAYKCESCGKLGRATKQSSLHTIPPILTLHLKRFRYGSTNNASSVLDDASSSRRRRGANDSALDSLPHTGKSGAAKIEGHISFGQILDIRPYLTKTLQDKHRTMLCRLFAIVVHTGKNSHSGHYLAYVRNVAKNEWWRMDDARVSRATQQQVMTAEAYMLFYRVVDHPVAQGLRNKVKLKQEKELKEQQQLKEAQEKQQAAAPSTPKESSTAPSPAAATTSQTGANNSDTKENKNDSTKTDSNNNTTSRKRKRRELPQYKTGEEWARANTKLLHPSSTSSPSNSTLSPKVLLAVMKQTKEFIAENLEFKLDNF